MSPLSDQQLLGEPLYVMLGAGPATPQSVQDIVAQQTAHLLEAHPAVSSRTAVLAAAVIEDPLQLAGFRASAPDSVVWPELEAHPDWRLVVLYVYPAGPSRPGLN